MFIYIVIRKFWYFKHLKKVNYYCFHYQNRSKKTSVTAKRIENIIEYLTYEVWRYMSRSLYNKDRILFTLLLAIKIDVILGQIKGKEFQIFIKGKILIINFYDTSRIQTLNLKALFGNVLESDTTDSKYESCWNCNIFVWILQKLELSNNLFSSIWILFYISNNQVFSSF